MDDDLSNLVVTYHLEDEVKESIAEYRQQLIKEDRVTCRIAKEEDENS